VAAGRTDTGVHARHQVVSFSAERDLPVSQVRRAITSMLGPEVVATDCAVVPTGSRPASTPKPGSTATTSSTQRCRIPSGGTRHGTCRPASTCRRWTRLRPGSSGNTTSPPSVGARTDGPRSGPCSAPGFGVNPTRRSSSRFGRRPSVIRWCEASPGTWWRSGGVADPPTQSRSCWSLGTVPSCRVPPHRPAWSSGTSNTEQARTLGCIPRIRGNERRERVRCARAGASLREVDAYVQMNPG
jgi:hypothetical protein